MTLCQVAVKNYRIINLALKYRHKTHPGSSFFIYLVPQLIMSVSVMNIIRERDALLSRSRFGRVLSGFFCNGDPADLFSPELQAWVSGAWQQLSRTAEMKRC